MGFSLPDEAPQASKWPPGPWDKEIAEVLSDVVGECLHTGMKFRISRHPEFGSLCGYVMLPLDHPLDGKPYTELDLEVHGGLTFSGRETESGRWVLGFDCNHCTDIAPGLPWTLNMPGATYKDITFCMKQCADLAIQIADRFPTTKP